MEEVINLYKFSLINSSSAHPFLEPSKEFQIEDILQLKNGNILIDVGYYNSVLTIFVVYDYNWESPLIKTRIPKLGKYAEGFDYDLFRLLYVRGLLLKLELYSHPDNPVNRSSFM